MFPFLPPQTLVLCSTRSHEAAAGSQRPFPTTTTPLSLSPPSFVLHCTLSPSLHYSHTAHLHLHSLSSTSLLSSLPASPLFLAPIHNSLSPLRRVDRYLAHISTRHPSTWPTTLSVSHSLSTRPNTQLSPHTSHLTHPSPLISPLQPCLTVCYISPPLGVPLASWSP